MQNILQLPVKNNILRLNNFYEYNLKYFSSKENTVIQNVLINFHDFKKLLEDAKQSQNLIFDDSQFSCFNNEELEFRKETREIAKASRDFVEML